MEHFRNNQSCHTKHWCDSYFDRCRDGYNVGGCFWKLFIYRYKQWLIYSNSKHEWLQLQSCQPGS